MKESPVANIQDFLSLKLRATLAQYLNTSDSQMLSGEGENRAYNECDLLLINPPYQRRQGSGIDVPLGLAYLASYVRSKGFLPKIIDCSPFFPNVNASSMEKLESWLADNVTRANPKLAIGIGPCTLSSAESLPIIEKACKRSASEIPIVYGGPLASIPEQSWFFFDYLNASAVIPGDAEIVIGDFLESLTLGNKEKVNGVIYSKDDNFRINLIENLDVLPFPDRELFDQSLYKPSIRRNLFQFPFATLVCSRGCPNACSFCSASAIRAGQQKKRSIENISKEISVLQKQGIRSLTFFDDCLFSNKSLADDELVSFSRAVKTYGKNTIWQIEMRPDVLEVLDGETIRVMFKNGCRQINIGAEKGSMKSLQQINKGLKPEQTVNACNKIKAACKDIRLTATFIIGGPGETREDALETIDFSTNLGLLYAHYYPLEVFPGTELYRRKFGHDQRKWLTELSRGIFKGSVVYEDILDKNEISALIRQGYSNFYGRPEWKALAKERLGSNYYKVRSSVESWGKNLRW